MKKKFLKKVGNIIMTALIITFAGSCNKAPLQPLESNNPSLDVGSARPAPSSQILTVSLRVTVNNASSNKITSDGKFAIDGTLDYINGQQSVQAVFDQYGNFIFNCGKPSSKLSSLPRWLNFNFDSRIGNVITAPPISEGNNVANAMTSVPGANISYTPIQNLAIDQTQCITLTAGPNYLNAPAWTVNFHRATEDVPGSLTGYAFVKRINATQWTMTPISSCSQNSNVAALRNGPGTLYGYYNMPFSFLLTKQ